MKLLVAAVTLVAVMIVAAPPHAEGSVRSKNHIDHFKHYSTCSTCPRTTIIDYGPDGKLNNRLWEAAAVNSYGEYIFYVWERGKVYYQGGRCTSKPDWSSDAHVYTQVWNRWHVEGKNAVSGGGPAHDGKPAYRYRRVMYHMVADTPWWTFRKDKYVGMTLRCDGTWAPAG